MFVTGLNGIQIFDITDVSDPVLVKQIPLVGSEYNRTFLAGSILYLGRWDHLYVFDVSDPHNPQQLCDRVLTGLIREIRVRDDRAYIGIGRVQSDYADTPALFIYDVSDPANPVSVGKYESPWEHKDCREFAVAGDYIYGVNHWECRVDVISIGDEMRPVFIDHTSSDYPTDLVYRDGYLYVAEHYTRIMIYDVTNPDSPTLSDSVIVDCETMEIHDNRLYVEKSGDIAVFDFQAPGQLSLAGLRECISSRPLSFADTLMFIPQRCYGFEIDDITDPSTISTIDRYIYPIHTLRGIDISGDYAYVVNYMSYVGGNRNGVHIVDVSDKHNPDYIRWVPLGGNPREALVYNDLLFVSGCQRTDILSLTNPTDPVFLSEFGWYTMANDVRGSILFVSSGGWGIMVADISDPANPDSISTLRFDDVIVGDMVLSGNLGYAATKYTLWTVDIADPSNIALLNDLELGGGSFSGYQMAKRGNYIYFADGIHGLFVIDLSDPVQPDIASCYQPGGPNYYDVVVKRNYLIVAYSSRFRVFDLSDPVNLESVQYVRLASPVQRLAVQDDYLYVASQCGLYLYHIELPPVACGDADGSGGIDIDDVVWLICYIFSSGPAPEPIESGDADCSGGIDIDDVVWLINYVFAGGNGPCDTDGDGVPDC
jgi:hypothetical protein